MRAGLRFSQINIPQGVTIRSARIDFTAAAADGGAPDLLIKLENADNAEAFSGMPFSTARAYRPTAVPWTSTLTANPLTDWEVDAVYSTPDLSAMVQGVVNRAGWCGGNNMVFSLERTGGDEGKRTAHAHEGGASRAAQLHVVYDNDTRHSAAASGNPDYCSSSTVTRKIAASSDDAMQGLSDRVELGNNRLVLGPVNSFRGSVGLRFQDIPIERGARITGAELVFTAAQQSLDPTRPLRLDFRGQAADDAATFTNNVPNDIRGSTNRPRTSTRITRRIPRFANINDRHTVSGLEPVIQEIIDRPEWEPGNALAILINYRGGQGIRRIKSYDGDNGVHAPVLEITFQSAPDEVKQTVRDRLKEIVANNLPLRPGTPLLSSMIEAARYLRGEQVIYGRQRGTQDPDDDRGTRVSHFASYDANGASVSMPDGCEGEDFTDVDCIAQTISGGSPTYKSPIVAECQTNYLVNLSDGKGFCTSLSDPGLCTGNAVPSATGIDLNELGYLEDFVAEDEDGNPVRLGDCSTPPDTPPGTHDACAVELAGFLAENDQIYTSAQNLQSGASPLDGLQNIRVYTIGFNLCGIGNVTAMSASGEEVCCRADSRDSEGLCNDPLPDPGTISTLKGIADAGDGAYFNASTVSELVSAFTAITGTIVQRSTSFVAPAIAANAFNRLQSRDEVYFGLFEPSRNTRWQGNIKKYGLCDESDPDGIADSGDECMLGDVLDVQDVVAIVDDASQGDDGLFRITATSYWTNPSEAPDGREITLGGAGGEITDFGTRIIYTEEDNNGVAANGASLVDYAINSNTWNSSRFEDVRSEVCPTPSTDPGSDCEDRMLYILGKDIENEDGDNSTDTRWWFHDVIHSSPRVVTYGRDNQGEFIDKVYVATNDGALHAINGLTGEEEWAFMPNTVFEVQQNLFDNSGEEHTYGLDSTPVLRVEDVDNDGVIEPDDGDFVHIYITQRRGGKNMYALDITPDSTLTSNATPVVPKFLWRIVGGQDDFVRMGDSWSEPQLTTIRTGAGDNNAAPVFEDVLVFAGGYDNDLDDIGIDTFYNFGLDGGDPNEGNAIYIVNADTGALIFWVGSDTTAVMSDNAGTGRRGADIVAADMNYAIPSNVSVNDTDGDGLGDRVYVGDTAGQIWRLDLAGDIAPGGINPEGSSVVGRLAAISTPGSVTEERRFYYPPAVVQVVDTALSNAPDGEFDYVLIPSGYRAHPLDTNVQDRIYAFRDSTIGPMLDCTDAGCAPNGFAEDYPARVDRSAGLGRSITNTDLADISLAPLSAEDASGLLGWYFDFNRAEGTTDSGEKGLSRASVFDGTVIVTTFIPSGPDTIMDACSASDGSGAVYNFDLLTGTAALDWNGDGDIDMSDRKQALGAGIPSEAVPVFTKEGVTILVGTGGGVANLGQVSELPRYRTYWYEES